MDFLKIKKHVARKNHTCWLCEKNIFPDNLYVEEICKYKGDFSSLKFHEKCFEILNEYVYDVTDSIDYDFSRADIIDWYIINKCTICEHKNFKCNKCKGLIFSYFCKDRDRRLNMCDKYSCKKYLSNDVCWDEDFVE